MPQMTSYPIVPYIPARSSAVMAFLYIGNAGDVGHQLVHAHTSDNGSLSAVDDNVRLARKVACIAVRIAYGNGCGGDVMVGTEYSAVAYIAARFELLYI